MTKSIQTNQTTKKMNDARQSATRPVTVGEAVGVAVGAAVGVAVGATTAGHVVFSFVYVVSPPGCARSNCKAPVLGNK